jgi:hypothetical protein
MSSSRIASIRFQSVRDRVEVERLLMLSRLSHGNGAIGKIEAMLAQVPSRFSSSHSKITGAILL